MGFSIVYKKLIFKEIKKAFRITCIMLILELLNNKIQLYEILFYIFIATI